MRLAISPLSSLDAGQLFKPNIQHVSTEHNSLFTTHRCRSTEAKSKPRNLAKE